MSQVLPAVTSVRPAAAPPGVCARSLALAAALLLGRCGGEPAREAGAARPSPRATPPITSTPAGATPSAPKPAGSAPASAEAERAATAFYAGLAALQGGDLARASEKLGELVELAPGEMAGHANLGLLELRRGRVDEARKRLEKARELAPGSPEVHALLGLVESQAGRSKEAIAHLEKALSLDPGDLRSRYALVAELEREGGAGAAGRATAALDAILAVEPGNLPVLLDRARAAAAEEDAAGLRAVVAKLSERGEGFSPEARKRLDLLAAADSKGAATASVVLRNVLVRDPAFQRDLAKVAAPRDSLGREIERPVTLAAAPAAPAEPDAALRYDVAAHPGEAGRSWSDGAGGRVVADVDHDFRADLSLAGPDGLRLLHAAEDGTFAPLELAGIPSGVLHAEHSAVWAADVESDGDLDLVAGTPSGAVHVLRNNADGTFALLEPFAGVTAIAAFAWGDVDGDGDPDAAFAGTGTGGELVLARNERGGAFRIERGFEKVGRVCTMAVGQLVDEANVDLAVLRFDGTLAVVSFDPASDGWRLREVATPAQAEPPDVGTSRLLLADADNNGAQDWVVASKAATRVLLVGAEGPLAPRTAVAAALSARAALDLDGDGDLELVGVDASGKELVASPTLGKGYHWLSLELRAQEVKGDQRINTFGIGGEVEVRSGLQWQKLPVESPRCHFGLGTRGSVDVARIVWPNGSVQAEHDLAADARVVAEQRLKGSCPWLFAWDGARMAFVTDVLWSSPLGLRINAQDTAGVVSTEDRVKVEGAALAARGGRYELSITAELWETHFFDHVALLVLDHPAGTELYQDERFSIPPPSLEAVVTGELGPVAAVRDGRGADVTSLVAERDGRYLAAFTKGRYQGVAEPHAVEIDLPELPGDGPLYLVAQGWTHPTDSSINVAMGQGKHDPPRGLSLEVRGAEGWEVLAPKLWFPAGKNKTILVDVSKAAGRSVRLATNLEISWDRLAVARGRPDVVPVARRLAPVRADLRARGYSRMVAASAASPEIPLHGEIAASGQAWRDLVGHCTAFGDVRELLASVDDRYVILNAGDEIALSFEALPPPAPGTVRDFVFVSDGWEKDGDLNTGFGKTVLPLPSHDDPDYRTPPRELEDDPVFARHPDDWVRFHTRYVTPEAFREALRPRSVIPPS